MKKLRDFVMFDLSLSDSPFVKLRRAVIIGASALALIAAGAERPKQPRPRQARQARPIQNI